MRSKNYVVHYFWCEGEFVEGWSKKFYHRKYAEKEMARLDKLYENIPSFLSHIIDYKIWN